MYMYFLKPRMHFTQPRMAPRMDLSKTSRARSGREVAGKWPGKWPAEVAGRPSKWPGRVFKKVAKWPGRFFEVAGT
jgi:hypothetical protein